MSTTDELLKLADLIEKADLVMLQSGEKRAGLGRDLQMHIAYAVRKSIDDDERPKHTSPWPRRRIRRAK
jgi:hypothetical protein